MKQHLYKANSLRNFCYGLNRILQNKGHLYDISDKKTASFQKSQQAFNDAIKELKSEGKGDVKSYPEIVEEGKIFLSFCIACCLSRSRPDAMSYTRDTTDFQKFLLEHLY